MHQSVLTVYRPQFCRAMPATIMPSSGGRPSTVPTARAAAILTTYSTNSEVTLPPGIAISVGFKLTRNKDQAISTVNSTATARAAVAGHVPSNRSNSRRTPISLLSLMNWTRWRFEPLCVCGSGTGAAAAPASRSLMTPVDGRKTDQQIYRLFNE